ncbi:type I restriction-modification system subunit M [Caproicibacterium argilliputei]|uniref:site-specific DNA-methyltransferase (adenine-specific) n=1 Tax=Caproicibacterium argilliputei TaxID=3030016 RepID=A0AA97DAN0_9FIRM|nr:class I SAM-dependent DNA methyltransferase [Caproicibacterium argilliputei]WOC31911.1 class I SAM-dependent DNA methyltransferase [Caproicibacterium argilliputei]
MAEKAVIDAMWDDSPVDVSTEVNFIWSIANKLRGTYRSDKYKDVIIPMTIIRRFECALEPTKQAVVDEYKKDPTFPTKAMYRVSGFQFYNTSEYTLAELINDPDHLAANFKSYIQGFSSNVQEILLSKEKGLNFGEEIDKMDKNNRLLSVVKAFSELDLNPHTIDNVKMGYIFEELIRKFSENAEAGDHYTGRDIIKLMVNILLAEGCDDIFDDGKVITILDQACGTGGMLSTGYNFIKRYNPTADVRLFGQEINPESYAMCLAEMLIKGQNAENICYQDTMKADRFPDIKMRFVLENPPFGQPWGGKDAAEGVEKAVNDEYEKGMDGRWGAGLPGSGDMQMLFLQSAINKLDDNYGRCAIIENGSPLFSGGTSSGESQIRRWLLENDLIEAIIELPTDLFYNTGIATYIWVLSKNKRRERQGYIQLIDASNIFHKLRKALGNKKNEISPEDRAEITKLYANFQPGEFVKIYKNTEFIYREYTVMQPLQRSYVITQERINAMVLKGSLSSLYDEAKVNELENAEELTGKDQKKLENYEKNKPQYDKIIEALQAAISDKVYLSQGAFEPVLAEVLKPVTTDKKLLGKIADGLSVMDKSAEIQKDKKGNIIYDKETKDTEIVKWDEDIDTYMKREVWPHIPDAKASFDEDLSKKNPIIKTGAEIPFTRYFYKYQQPVPSEELETKFMNLEKSVSERVAKLFD